MLETNIRQRGDIGGSSIKLGRRIKELERIYGIKQGNNQHNEDTTNGLTQEDLAQKLGINLKTLQRAKSLANLSPEIQQLIEQGNISASTAARVIGSKLSKEESTAANTHGKKIGNASREIILIKKIKSYTFIQILVFR